MMPRPNKQANQITIEIVMIQMFAAQ